MLKPDLVIPFKLDKNDAKAAFKKHISGKRLLPKTFKDENHIDEIKGIYVPFWLFDAHADASVTYDAETVRTWSDSDYNYTETKYYKAYRSGYTDFAAIPVDGSQKMADDLMESIEPYNLSEAVDFQTAYLAGYFADKYDVTADQRCRITIRYSPILRCDNRYIFSRSLTVSGDFLFFSSTFVKYTAVS